MALPIRVAHVITRMIVGGAQELVLSIIGGLDPDRFRSVLFTGPETGPEGSLLPKAGRMGIEVVEVPTLVRSPSLSRDLSAFRFLRRELARGRFQVANTYTSKAGFVGTLAARSAGVPVVVYSPQGHIFSPRGSIPGVTGKPIRRRLFLALRRAASRRADALVALHPGDRDEQVALGLAPAGKFRVIPNGIDPGLPAARDGERGRRLRAALGLEGRGPVVVTVGRLAPEKGHLDLLEAMALLAPRRPEAALVVAGGGPLRAALERRAEELGIAGSVRFLGIRSDVPDVLAACDIFALASHYESFGLAILEAMGAGLPVAATRVGGIPFLVQEGVTGLLAPPGSPAELARRLEELAADPARARGMGLAGRARLEETFSRRAMVRGVEEMYLDLLRAKEAA